MQFLNLFFLFQHLSLGTFFYEKILQIAAEKAGDWNSQNDDVFDDIRSASEGNTQAIAITYALVIGSLIGGLIGGCGYELWIFWRCSSKQYRKGIFHALLSKSLSGLCCLRGNVSRSDLHANQSPERKENARPRCQDIAAQEAVVVVDIATGLGSFGEAFWYAWGIITMFLTIIGALSMLRPAADVFVAGFSEAFPSMYFVVIWVANTECDRALVRKTATISDENKTSDKMTLSTFLPGDTLSRYNTPHSVVSKPIRILLLVAMLLNAPLIIVYPLILSYFPEMPLGYINCFLHCWLTVAWGLQYWTLKQYCIAYESNISAMKGHRKNSMIGVK